MRDACANAALDENSPLLDFSPADIELGLDLFEDENNCLISPEDRDHFFISFETFGQILAFLKTKRYF